jgi:Ca2+-binding RTX toxin-like protein
MLSDPDGGGGANQHFQLERLLAHAAGPWVLDRYDQNGVKDTSGDYEAVIVAGGGAVAQGIRYTSPAEIAVFGNGAEIADNDTSPSATDHTHFGGAAEGGPPVTRTFTVRNEESATLILGAPILPSGFTLGAADPLVGSLAPGASDTFQVQLSTAAAGSWSGEIVINSNDGDESAFNFAVAGIVAPAPRSPVIASNGGAAAAAVAVAENSLFVTTVAATDPDSAALSYSLSGGADQGRFTINAVTGVLSFVAAPNFEAPADSDRNNSYVVEVRASDGALSDTQQIIVSVVNLAETLIIGSAGNDRLSGGAGHETIRGGAGNDIMNGNSGNDRMDGGAGKDIMSGGAGHDRLVGGHGNDSLRGHSGNDRLDGAGGRDKLIGDTGSDVLLGGFAADTLTGGGGRDAFLFNTALSSSNLDRVTDFRPVDDTIHIDNAVFRGLRAGRLAADAFHVSTSSLLAADAEDRIVYQKTTGAVFFDANGDAAGGAIKFAQLAAGLSLTNADFLVI